MKRNVLNEMDVVRRLKVSAAQGRAVQADVPTRDFDWNVPCRCTAEHLGRLQTFGELLAQKLSQALGALLRDTLQLQCVGTSLIYYRDVRSMAGTFRVALAYGNKPLAALSLGRPQSVAWVDKLLGSDAAADGERTLSSLEMALLTDIFAALTAGLSAAAKEHALGSFTLGGEVKPDASPIAADDVQEVCRLQFQVPAAAAADTLTVLVPCELIEPILFGGPLVVQSPADARKGMADAVEQTTLSAQVCLGRLSLKMREILMLEAGDVLLLPGTIADPLSASIQGVDVLTASLGQSNHNYGLQVLTSALQASPPAAKTAAQK